MKSLLLGLLFVNSAWSAVLLERELYNARNGESHVCRIHDDNTTEILNEGVSQVRTATVFEASEGKVMSWLEELKASAKSGKMDLKEITQYVHQGVKTYSFYKGSEKISYYQLEKLKSRTKIGSIERKVSNDKGNVQRLRGQTDLACKNAHSKI
jgi:hypothetical protein